MMMIAQSTASALTGTQFFYGLLALVGVNLFPFVKDWMKDRRERENATRDSVIQTRIADSNEQMRDRLGNLATEIRVSNELGTARHNENLKKFDGLCKATCPFNASLRPSTDNQPSKT